MITIKITCTKNLLFRYISYNLMEIIIFVSMNVKNTVQVLKFIFTLKLLWFIFCKYTANYINLNFENIFI